MRKRWFDFTPARGFANAAHRTAVEVEQGSR
jgi:hypothetical protein